MRKGVLTFALLLLLVAHTGQAQETSSYDYNNLRYLGQVCVFGGTVLGMSALFVLFPTIIDGLSGIPVISILLGNTFFGCGIAMIGVTAVYGFNWFYDRFIEAPQYHQIPSELGRRNKET